MSATIINLRPCDDVREDPWQTAFGLKPFRERYPLWERTPATISDYLQAAENEFPMLGICEVTQRHPMARLEGSSVDMPDEHGELLTAFIGLSRRHGKMAKALQGEALRFGLAALRVRHRSPITDDLLLHIMALVGVDP